MAGIGFTLNKLSQQDNLSGTVLAYIHSAFIATGPWLLTVLAIGSSVILGEQFASKEALETFRLILIYNFSLSMVVSAPICMIATRYLADEIHRQELGNVPGLLVGTLLVNVALQAPIAFTFYLGGTTLNTFVAVNAAINFLAIGTIWLVAVFLSALKEYSTITRAFALGLFSGTAAGLLLSANTGGHGILIGFNLGILTILFLLLGQVLAEYPFAIKQPFAFLGHFRKYWELALGGWVYNIACWIDKWMLWTAPEAERSVSGMWSYPNYDSAMFLAYLTTVPAIAGFVFNIETAFYERYIHYYQAIQKHATLQQIRVNLASMIRVIGISGRNHILLQGALATVAILMAPNLLGALKINYLQLGIFRYGVLGAFFHITALFGMILLSYFDSRRTVLKLQFLFLVSNTALTWWTMKLGFPYYGLGYTMATIITFAATAGCLFRYVRYLTYHTFISTNTSVG